MSKRHFDKFLEEYKENYYSKYNCKLENIGEEFLGFNEESEGIQFENWIAEFKKKQVLHTSGEKRYDTPSFTYKDNELANAFSIAIKHYLKPEFNAVEDTYLKTRQKEIANNCGVAENTVSCWTSGERIPNKYAWWAFAITEAELSYQDILPFLDMIGETIDMTCIDDIILYYALCTFKTRGETYEVLEANGCHKTKDFFMSAMRKKYLKEISKKKKNN